MNGTFNARAVHHAFGKANTGTRSIGVMFEVTTEGEHLGAKVLWYGHFTEKTLERTLESLRYCGWTGDALAADMPGLYDNEVQIVVEEEDYQDDQGTTKTRTKVQWVNRAAAVSFKNALDTDDLASLTRELKGEIIASKDKVRGPRPTPPGGPKPASGGVPARSQASRGGTTGHLPNKHGGGYAGGGGADAPFAPTGDDEIPF